MPVRGDEVTDRIEARIREAVERLVGEVRTSIDDVRDAIDQQLKAAVQSVQADMKSLSFRSEVEEEVKGLEESLRSSAPPTPAISPSSIRQAIVAIEAGKTQVEVLTALLDQCLGYGSRAALLILRTDGFAGWKGSGFTLHGGNDDAIKRFTAPAGKIPQLNQLMTDERMIAWDGASMAEQLGVKSPDAAALIPMVIKDKVAAAVYVDAIGEDRERFDPAALQILVFATGLLVDTLALRRTGASPTLRGDFVARERRPAAGPVSRQAPTGGATGNIAGKRNPQSEQTVAIRNRQLREMLASLGGAGSGERPPGVQPANRETASYESISRPPSAPSPSETSTSEAKADEPSQPSEDSLNAQQELADRPSTQYIPPPGLTRRRRLRVRRRQRAQTRRSAEVCKAARFGDQALQRIAD